MGIEKKIVQGRVLELLPDARFRIELDEGKEIIGFTSGRMKMNKIKVIPGDRVSVELDPWGGHATNRVIRRL